MQNPKDVLDSIVHIIKTRRFDRENDLAVSYRVHGKWVNSDEAVNAIRSLARKTVKKTHVYEVQYRVNDGFPYSLNVDSHNKRDAKIYIENEMRDQGKVKILLVKRVKEL